MLRVKNEISGLGYGVQGDDLRLDRVTQHLNVWASVTIHRALGGFGIPEIQRCGLSISLEKDPEIDEGRGTKDEGRVCVRISTKATEAYDASFAKYKASGPRGLKVDKKAQEVYLTVCSMLGEVGNPAVLTGLLLWIYPTDGDFVIKRPSNWSAENPYRSYRPEVWVKATFGHVGHKYLDQSIDRMLMNMESGFRTLLGVAMRGKG